VWERFTDEKSWILIIGKRSNDDFEKAGIPPKWLLSLKGSGSGSVKQRKFPPREIGSVRRQRLSKKLEKKLEGGVAFPEACKNHQQNTYLKILGNRRRFFPGSVTPIDIEKLKKKPDVRLPVGRSAFSCYRDRLQRKW
jgi:hypothetical protein